MAKEYYPLIAPAEYAAQIVGCYFGDVVAARKCYIKQSLTHQSVPVEYCIETISELDRLLAHQIDPS